ncbi:MAG TPA: type II toxin-antitoxin system RelE/ParE family toxin [Aeromicrobium sp.]|nr:type II toxin-antitoxin system RelE/ParE family toxin [Aeromicrobium sp.]
MRLPVEFVGDSLRELRGFPEGSRRKMGYQIDRVQNGFDPIDWKPMPAIGSGVREIRVRDAAGAFRAIYVVAAYDAVYVLRCFHKKREKTARSDLELARRRLHSIGR